MANMPVIRNCMTWLCTRNSAVADNPHDTFVQMQWRGWSNQRY